MATEPGRSDREAPVKVVREDLDHPLVVVAGMSQIKGSPVARVGFCIASAPRNGSTLLAGAIWSSGRLGRPDEYFRPGDEALWADRWGLEWPNRDGYAAYVAAMLHASTTPNGVFSMKLFPSHALGVTDTVFAPGSEHFGDLELKLVHLRRRDKVRAALSEWKAQMTGQWVRLAGEPRPEVPRSPRSSELTKFHEHQHAWDRFWCGARADGVDWIELFYEDVAADVGAAVERIGDLVGEPDVRCDRVVPPIRQTEPIDEVWINRWVSETGGCSECGHFDGPN